MLYELCKVVRRQRVKVFDVMLKTRFVCFILNWIITSRKSQYPILVVVVFAAPFI